MSLQRQYHAINYVCTYMAWVSLGGIPLRSIYNLLRCFHIFHVSAFWSFFKTNICFKSYGSCHICFAGEECQITLPISIIIVNEFWLHASLLPQKYVISIFSKFRSSHRKWFLKITNLKNSAKFTGKHLCQSLFLNKVKCKFCKIFKNSFFTEHLQATPFGNGNVFYIS